MEFKNFSLAIGQTKVARFADDLTSGKIMSTICKKCGKRYDVHIMRLFAPNRRPADSRKF